MPRGIDHVVIAVRDLDAARKTYERLGFILTPEARHPFGTANTIAQLDGSFIELLGIADSAAIPPATDAEFSFGAFNRRYLESREGMSMLALHSDDAAGDRADFAARGLPVYEPFHFERMAKGSDGIERPLSFSVTFTSDARMPDAGVFTVHHEHPENFWREFYQYHPNGVTRIAAVVLAAPDPADFHEFFFHVTGQHDMRSDSMGVAIDTGSGRIELMTPVAVEALYGETVEAAAKPHFVALRLAAKDLDAVRTGLSANGIAFREIARRVVVPASEACGVAIAFAAEAETD
ncbi:VOC family protein [Bauldia sp.]|uniref:VOC family protein n=1 Tax=Bauldia sp. TaxID=2575872 RepID=UPI003BACF6DB